MLNLDAQRVGPPPRDASTMIVLREGPVELEVFFVRRSKQSSFLGGALVFPGGKVEESDFDGTWAGLCSALQGRTTSFGESARALAIAACRELLEEGALLPSSPPLDGPSSLELAARVRAGSALLDEVQRLNLRLDLSAVLPFGRWVTPEAEARRFDARFFLWLSPSASGGLHDGRETTQSFWARPSEVLERAESGEFFLAPPTSRCLELLSGVRDFRGARALAEEQSLEPICPVWMPPASGAPGYLALPGDPSHPIRQPLIAGASRYVQRGERFCAEGADP